MSKSIQLGKDNFHYVNNGKYIRIIGYSHEDGTLLFTKEQDGRSYFHIHIPETIDRLPVLVVDALRLDVDYRQHYRHNGMDVVMLHLPEQTAFSGLGQIGTGMNSVFVPNHTEEYYPRKDALLATTAGTFWFFADAVSDTTCAVYAIIGENHPKKDWVWSKQSPTVTSDKELRIPSEIKGYAVSVIRSDSTYALPSQIEKVYIEEGVEEIGDDCFAGLPCLTDVYLPKSIKSIGKGAFSYYVCSEFVHAPPTLTVHYYDTMPPVGEGAFVRRADIEKYEDYADWGSMHVGTTHKTYEVVYKKNP